MAATGNGDLQHNSPNLLDLPDVNLEEYLHCFDDPISLDLLTENYHAAIQQPNDASHSSDRIEPLLGVGGSNSHQPRHKGKNEAAQPPDKSNSPKVWPFSKHPSSIQQILDLQGRQQTIKLETSMIGLFFEAQNPCSSPHTTGSSLSSAELTCYRRNMFMVNATVSLPQDGIHSILSESQSEERIVGLHAQLQAIESMKKGKADLVKAPSKNAPPGATSESQPLSVSISLEPVQSTLKNPPIAISWERIQFRKSTIKSPRPTRPMQTYRIYVEVVGTLSDGRMVPLVRSESRPIIVRGRSPKCYLSDQKLQINQPLPAAAMEDLIPPSPPAISPDMSAESGVLPLIEAGEEFDIHEENRQESNGFVAPENDDYSRKFPDNYSYIPMPIMDWSPPVEAFFVGRLLYRHTPFLIMAETNLELSLATS